MLRGRGRDLGCRRLVESGLVEEGPGIGDDDEDVILLQGRGVSHELMGEKAGHFARTGKGRTRLKLGVASLSHLLAERRPGISMNGKDDKHLERMEAFERRLLGLPGRHKGRELDEAAAFQLRFVERGGNIGMEKVKPRTDDRAGEGDNGHDSGECG